MKTVSARGTNWSLKLLAVVSWCVGLSLLVVFYSAPPAIKLLVASLGLLVFVKLAAYLWQRSEGGPRLQLVPFLLYMFSWPGVDVSGFRERRSQPLAKTGERFLESWIALLLGIAGLVFSAYMGGGESILWNYVGLYCFLLIFHLGLVEVMTDGLRLLGYSPQSGFDRPYLATSLRDFWSYRWNRAFIDMNKIFFLKTFKNKVPAPVLILFIFAISGVLHELALSYPVNAGWGLPLLYFVIQGAGFLLERQMRFPRVLVLAWVILPSPLLFHPWFVNGLVGPLAKFLNHTIVSLTLEHVWFYGLVAGGVLHLLVLMASIQVPVQLRWREQFALLNSLNRKVFWTYGAYIFCIILFCGGVSFYLSGLSRHVPAVGVWPLFIALFWWARVGVDTLYMSHADWPQGPLFTVGHVCLSTVFGSLALLYSGLFIITWK